MTLLKETAGDTIACDGCGRTDAGPDFSLRIKHYTVVDPNRGGAVEHDLCPGCAANRGLTAPIATIAGWEASPPAAATTESADPTATDEEPPA